MEKYIWLASLVTIFFIQQGACFHANETGETESISANSNERFLSLFSVVRFANSLCYGNDGFNGTCFTSAECSALGGTASGTCASGFGVCCTICLMKCGQTVTVNNTYWANPGYPSNYSTEGQCSVTVKKCSSNICQLRLDFVNFNIAGPEQTTSITQCKIDSFTVSGQSNNVPTICGSNTNQHMYLDMTPGTSQFTLNMVLYGTTTPRSWKIRIAQIPCGTSYTAPDNCLQWYTSSVGTFSSFNFLFSTTPNVQKLANQDYTICIRMNQGFCGICYQVCDVPLTAVGGPPIPAFELSGSAVTSLVDSAGCTTDWIEIPCATDTQSTSAKQTGTTPALCVSKICGGAFSSQTGAASSPVYSYRKPFEVRVYTDSTDVTNDNNVGFCLKYQQLTCSSG